MKVPLLLFFFFITIKLLSQDTVGNHPPTLSSISFFRSQGGTIYFNYLPFHELLQMTSLSIFPPAADSFPKTNSPNPSFQFRQFKGSVGFRTQRGRVKNSKSEWQIGISYADAIQEMRPFSFHHNVVIPGDTLTSGNLSVRTDTLVASSYEYKIAMNEIAFDGVRILNADLSHRLRISSGLGIQAGFTINSTVRALHDTSILVSYYVNDKPSSLYGYILLPVEQETENLKSSIFIRSYLPVSI